MPKTKAAKPRGRPTVYSVAIAEGICNRIAAGESLAAICRGEGMPAAPTVRAWIVDDLNGFAALSSRAYGLGYEALAEECLEIADTPIEGVETVVKADGGVEERRGDMLAHRRLQIETRMRLLGKWAAKRYGDKLDLKHSGGVSVVPVTPADEAL